MTVSKILKKKGRHVTTARPSQTVEEALGRLGEDDVGAVVVTDDEKRIVGIVSERDIVRALESVGVKALTFPLSEVMTRDPITCHVDDRVAGVMAAMDDQNIRHVPVVDNGRVAGIISIRDIIKLRLDEVQSEADAMREFIGR